MCLVESLLFVGTEAASAVPHGGQLDELCLELGRVLLGLLHQLLG